MPAQNGTQVTKHTTAEGERSDGENGLLRELKGAPLSVLLALEMYGEQGRVELVERTGWSYSAVQNATNKLMEMGLVQRLNYRTWILVDGVTVEAVASYPQVAEVVSKNNSRGEMVSESNSENKMAAENGSGSGAEVTSITVSNRAKKAEVVTENSSSAEVVSKSISAPYDHDGVIDTKEHNNKYKHQPSKTTMKALAQTLQTLDPPFDNAEQWLQETSPQLVQGWLDYLQSLDREGRRRIRNEAAFVRWKVESEQAPPPLPQHGKPCGRCGRRILDAQGNCLVCLHIVVV